VSARPCTGYDGGGVDGVVEAGVVAAVVGVLGAGVVVPVVLGG
jgi:hypothetical protein